MSEGEREAQDAPSGNKVRPRPSTAKKTPEAVKDEYGLFRAADMESEASERHGLTQDGADSDRYRASSSEATEGDDESLAGSVSLLSISALLLFIGLAVNIFLSFYLGLLPRLLRDLEEKHEKI